MGTLDEAIREHLELRRRHGANPAEVAREEIDALAPVMRDGEPELTVSSSASPFDGGLPYAPFDDDSLGRRVTEGAGAASSRAASLMQETAEIDMRAVLADGEPEDSAQGVAPDRELHVEVADPVAAIVRRSPLTAEVDLDSLGWEAPGPRVRRVRGVAEGGRALGGERPAEASAP